jgi:hypothetical protein
MYYKAPDNSIHCIDPEFAHMLPFGSIQISEKEFQSLRPIKYPPKIISPKQIRKGLSRIGLRNNIESFIENGNQDLKDWWEYSESFLDNDPELIEIMKQLNVSESQLKDLFELAQSL